MTVTVGLTTPPAATIGSFTATPTSVVAGQSTTLTWSSSNASSCTATGGTGGDGWTGAVPTSSSGFVVGPIGNIGTVNYTLTCTGSGGTSAPSTVPVTVTAPPPGSPTVSILANGSNPAQIQPGAAPTLSWTSANTTACTATGGTGSDGWGGTQPLTSSGVTLTAINVPGIYSYTLTCTGPSGSAAASVLVTVISSSAADCGVGFPTTALLAPAASASGGISGLCLLGGCSVTNLPNLTNANQTDFATISIPVGVGATGSIQVNDSAATFPGGRRAGFVIAPTSAQLSAGLLPNVTVRTLKGGVIQESSTVNNSLQLSAVGLLSDPNAGFAGFTTTKSFDSVRLEVTAPALVLSTFDVYGSCVSLQ